jgi:CAAX protease family protein
MTVSPSATKRAISPPTDGVIQTPPGREGDRSTSITQYTLTRIVAVWATAAVPMAVLAWIVVPALSHSLGGREPLVEAILVCFTAGLLWMLLVTLVLVRREQGGLGWPLVRDALWLRPPRAPKSGRVGGKVWWWVLPFTVLSVGINALPIDPTGPMPRDLPEFIGTDRAERFFHGNWTWFAMAALVSLLAPVVEELFFRGLLLPRMRAVCGRADFVANGAIFTAFHLHQPWSMPATLLDGIFTQAYPARRFQSIWIGLVTHTVPSFAIIGFLFYLVIK